MKSYSNKVVLLLLAVVANLFFGMPVLAADPVAHWKFDEGTGTTATDSSGNGHAGTISGATYATFVPPDVDFADPYSLEFDGVNDGVTTPLSLNGSSEFTLAGWAYPRSAAASEGWFGANNVFEFIFNDPTTLRCWTSVGAVNWSFAGDANFLNNWHHITCLGTGDSIELYVDGNQVASTTHSHTTNYGSGDTVSIGIGVQNGGSSGPFDGFIDDVRVYTVALTPSEMQNLGTGSDDPSVPVVELGYPTDGAVIHMWPPSVEWGSATSCEYNLDDLGWETVDCSQSGSDIPEPAEGPHTLRVRGASGGEWAEASVDFTLDQTGPVVSITAPTPGDTVATSSFTATVDWGDAVDCHYSYDGFGNIFPADCSQGGADIPAPLELGETTLSVMGDDEVGNTTEAYVTFSVTDVLPQEETLQESTRRSGGSVQSRVAVLQANGNTVRADELKALYPNLFDPTDLAALKARVEVLRAQLEGTMRTNSVRDLTIGMEGEDVRFLQALLIAKGYTISAGVTGYFGSQTRAALSAYQSAKGVMPATGYFGALTRAVMKNAGLEGLWW